MTSYRLNPYISFVESRLFPEFTQQAAFNRLTGDLVEPSQPVLAFLQSVKPGKSLSLNESELMSSGPVGKEIVGLIRREFLVSEDYDPLTPLLDHFVTRPIQNPALVLNSSNGEWILVRTSMEQTVYSRKFDEFPPIIEEKLSALMADIFLSANGRSTLREIFSKLRSTASTNIAEDSEFRSALDFLTAQERQLIKFTTNTADLDEPFSPVNIIPRNLFHSDRWTQTTSASSNESIVDFHLQGIEDADWEFDLIEPTVNHSFRFPHEALGGLSYGARFCVSTLSLDVVPLLEHKNELDVLEVGGGTGRFAESFIRQANALPGSSSVNLHYHILDLSPALMRNQRSILRELLPESNHFHQNATEFDLPEHAFDLIISNEVIADFPVASVERNTNGEVPRWQGEGAYHLEKYGLSDAGAPESFLVNSGAFRFIERAWKHLRPGGTLIVSEYGAEQRFPARSFHLNHDEYSIHFGHLATCAASVGFQCRLVTLKEFLGFDDEVLVLNGREEHILCMNHVFNSFGVVGPLAVISKGEFEQQYKKIAERIRLTGYSFSQLKKGYHYGPAIKDFFVLIMNKPTDQK